LLSFAIVGKQHDQDMFSEMRAFIFLDCFLQGFPLFFGEEIAYGYSYTS